MKKIILLCIACLFSSGVLSGQNSLRDFSHIGSRTKAAAKVTASSSLIIEDPLFNKGHGLSGVLVADTVKVNQSTGAVVLYREVVRKYTWLEGVGEPITQKIADGLPYYYRLSEKNEKGHYQLVEAMKGASLTDTHSVRTYLAIEDSDFGSPELRSMAETIGQWHFSSDLSGQYVLEERAYSAVSDKPRLVYAMQVEHNDSNHITVSYTDSDGLPIDLVEDENAVYGSLFYITYDSKGHDLYVRLTDGAGTPQCNEYGVWQIMYEYDDEMKPASAIYTNCFGKRMTLN